MDIVLVRARFCTCARRSDGLVFVGVHGSRYRLPAVLGFNEPEIPVLALIEHSNPTGICVAKQDELVWLGG